MRFVKNDTEYTLIRTGNTTSDGVAVFKFVAYNKKGQAMNIGEVCANCAEEAKSIILEW